MKEEGIMDTKTGQIFGFSNPEELRGAKELNPNLQELPNCRKEFCEYYKLGNGKSFCRASRKIRRSRKCFVKFG